MTIQQAIEKAREGGWERPAPCEIEGIEVYHKGDTLLDPLFWQSLGKAMGWKWCPFRHYPHTVECVEWIVQWHCFIDHLAEGKTAESFFETLTK